MEQHKGRIGWEPWRCRLQAITVRQLTSMFDVETDMPLTFSVTLSVVNWDAATDTLGRALLDGITESLLDTW
jgi:hypothetical protein